MEFRKAMLDNGLEVVAECNDLAHSAAIGFFVQTGSRDETSDTAGVSHFLEHMLFKGTPRRTADDVNREFDEMGAHYNAFTSEENTVFYAAVLPEFVDRAVELLGDIMRPSLRQADFETEKQVIIEEIRMYEDQPPFGADDKCKAACFGDHPLGQSVLGTVDGIETLSVDAMRGYFGRRYSPGNVVLAASGRIDFAALVDHVGRCCGHWETGPTGRIVEPAVARRGFHILGKEAAAQQYAIGMATGPSATDDDRYPAKLAATILGDDSGSRFYWELIDPGLAEHASLSHYDYEGSGMFITYLSCDPPQAADNLQRILDIYRQVETDGVTPAELAQAKSKITSRVVLSGERPRGRLFAVGSDWTQRRAYRSVRDDLDAVASVTPEQIAAVLARHPLSRGTTVTVGPLAEVAEPS